ncbi:MAG TPA: XrtA-associated tyrosine autokinase [Alphaproteobacteria bacterium]|nr:XrtA-associated tyrosine autokinase [Alphaproteobacteria bacterium]
MAGNRFDMIERAAARLRGATPPATTKQQIVDQPQQPPAFVQPQRAAAAAPVEVAPPVQPQIVDRPAAASRVPLNPLGPTRLAGVAPPVPVVEKSGKTSRTVVLDTARLALAGTVDWNSDRTPVMEELRLIKRRLLRKAFPEDRQDNSISHLVMITSAKPREGKTFTSTNIAISISMEEDYNVLLVDADIRRQALRQNLGLEANQGFVDLLLNPGLDMADVLLRTNIPRLSVLPAGTMSDRAPELLASARMRDLIDDMARRYHDRIILFDTAPCLVSSDAATLAAHVGQIVFVVEAEQTQQHEIIAALNLISACPDISFILNKAQPLATTSYGGYGAY